MEPPLPYHLLFHRSTPWHSHLECSTKTYAKRFRRLGCRVTYLQDLARPEHLLLRRGYFETWRRGCRDEEGVWVAATASMLPRAFAAKAWPIGLRSALFRCAWPSVRSVVRRGGGGDPDLIWTTPPGSSALKRLFPGSRLVFHVVDYYPAFHGEAVRSTERRDYAAADHVFSIGEALTAYLRDELGVKADKITTLGQGAPVERYASIPLPPDEYMGLPRPIGVWVGALSKLDRALLLVTADAMAQRGGSLALIGQGADRLGRHAHHEAVHLLGPRSPADVPRYLAHADVGLMLYDRERKAVYHGQNPLKLYEYAAAGLPALSTPHAEYRTLQPPVRVVETEADIHDALDDVLTKHTSYRAQMRAFAEEHRWAACVESAQRVIKALLSASEKRG